MGLPIGTLVVLSVALLWVRRAERRRTAAGVRASALSAAGRR